MSDHTSVQVSINGAPHTLDAGSTLVDLLARIGIAEDRRGVAVAINGTVVRRADWRGARLAAGDAVEIVTAKQGG